MPQAITGRVTLARTAGAVISGEVSIAGPDGPSFGGLVSIGHALSDACAAETRGIGVTLSLSIGGVWVPLDGVAGKIAWGRSLDTVADWATFDVSDSRMARYHASSLAAGGVPVRIDVRVRTSDSDATILEFLGTTLASSNKDSIRPLATVRAKGLAGAWEGHGRHASVTRPAGAGLTRSGVLAAWAAAAGLSTAGMVIPTGGRIAKAIDLTSVTGGQLLERFAAVERWHYRPRTSGAVEILPAGYTDGASRFDFTPANYYSLAEQLPDAPVTFYTLTGEQLDEAALALRRTNIRNVPTAAGGTVSVTLEYEGTAETRRSWTEGSGLSERRVEVVTTWNRDAEGRPTGQMATRRTLITSWVNPEVAVSAGTLCADGKYHASCTWTWQPMSDVLETLTWGDCYLERKVTTTRRFYAPLGFRSNAPDDCLRQDGTYRSVGSGATADALMEVSLETVDYEADDTSTIKRIELWGWGPDGYETDAGPPVVTTGKEAYKVVQLLAGSAVRTGAGTYDATMAGANGASLAASLTGPMPRPPAARANEPQHQLQPLQLTYEIGGSGYPYNEASLTIAEAQSMAELRNAAEHIAEPALGTRYVIPHPAVCGLEPGDPGTLTALLKRDAATGATERVRALTAKPGYVETWTKSYDTASGAFEQTTTMMVPWKRTAA